MWGTSAYLHVFPNPKPCKILNRRYLAKLLSAGRSWELLSSSYCYSTEGWRGTSYTYLLTSYFLLWHAAGSAAVSSSSATAARVVTSITIGCHSQSRLFVNQMEEPEDSNNSDWNETNSLLPGSFLSTTVFEGKREEHSDPISKSTAVNKKSCLGLNDTKENNTRYMPLSRAIRKN
jgi:hypothetical protein